MFTSDLKKKKKIYNINQYKKNKFFFMELLHLNIL